MLGMGICGGAPEEATNIGGEAMPRRLVEALLKYGSRHLNRVGAAGKRQRTHQHHTNSTTSTTSTTYLALVAVCRWFCWIPVITSKSGIPAWHGAATVRS